MTVVASERFADIGTQLNGIWGAKLDSANATIAPTHKFHLITGTGAVDTITPPSTDFAGIIYFVGDGTWTFTTNGNVAIACTGKTLIAVGMVYNPVTAKWYPIADAVAD